MKNVTVVHHAQSPACGGVCCDGDNRIEAIFNVPGNDPAFMSTKVHPIFRAENFPHESNISRPCLMQALRLATRFIDSTLPFFYTLMWGETVVLREESQDAPGQIHFVDVKEELTDLQRSRTQADLERSADWIIFRLDEREGCSGVGIEFDLEAKKSWVVINIEKMQYEDLLHAYEHGTDAVHNAWIQTELARTICHEVVHAIMVLAHGGKVEAYFGDSQVAEEGFEWEKRLFGGIFKLQNRFPRPSPYRVDNVPSAMERMIVLTEWPNMTTVSDYKENDWKIGVRGEVPKAHICWHTRAPYFINLLQDSWWSTEYASKGLAALQSKKVTGARYVASEVEFLADGVLVDTVPKVYEDVPYYIETDEEGLVDTIPRGYEATETGLIVPMDGPPSPCESGTWSDDEESCCRD